MEYLIYLGGLALGLLLGPVGDIIAWHELRKAAKLYGEPVPRWNWRILSSGIAYMLWLIRVEEDDNASNGQGSR